VALSTTTAVPAAPRPARDLPPVPGHHPGADRGEPLDPAALRRVLVVRADNAGDVVTATPALRALRHFAPHAEVDLLTSPAGAAVTPLVPGLHEVITVSPSWQQLTCRPTDTDVEERRVVATLRARNYDTMVVLTSYSQSPWPVAHIGLLAGIGTRVVHSREFGGAVATHWVTPPPETTHVVDRSLHLLASVGVPPRGAVPRLRVPDADDATAGRLVGPAPFALLAPGATCSSRRYPATRFGRVAALVAATGLPVRVSGTPAEAALVAEVVASAGIPTSRRWSRCRCRCSAGSARRAAVAITNNSGGMHIADALGTPVAVTYAGTERVGDARPRAVPAAVLGLPVPCSPCRQLQCPFDLQCLDVTPERVAAAAVELARPRKDRP
jgi:ADP-heptose:LPS heptosyltransferase